MAEWAFVVGPSRGPITTWLKRARDRKVTFRLSSAGHSEASCTLDGRRREAGAIQELATDLHVLYRRSLDVPRQRLYVGRIGKTTDKVGETSHTVTVPSVDYRQVLERRLLMTGSNQVWNAGTDLADVAWGLLGEAQNKDGGNYGITRGFTTFGIDAGRREFKLGDAINAKIQELSEAPIGFDWDIIGSTDPDSNALAMRAWSPGRGSAGGVVLEYGRSVTAFDRTIDSSNYANAVRLTGQPPDGSQVQPAIQERYATDLSTAPQGRWDKAYGTDVTSSDGLATRADWQIADSQVVQPTYTLTLAAGWWTPGRLWLGDTARFIAQSGPRIDVDTSLRTQEIAVDISADGTESSVQVTIGPARPDYRRRAADVERRLSTLERR